MADGLEIITTRSREEYEETLKLPQWKEPQGALDFDPLGRPGPVRYNFNDVIRVRLTDEGRRIHQHNHERLLEMMPAAAAEAIGPYKPKAEDENGWSEWQGWDLMREFGPWMRITLEPPFELTVELEELKANSRLIAAAPDLLAACESALDQFEAMARDVDTNPWCEELRTAIKKARGEIR